MALTLDVEPEEGGILVRGTAEELTEFAEAILAAVEDAESRVIGSLLTKDGVEDVRVEVDDS